jgi:Tetratricopeptide repeat/Glycosyltransferase family 9 (heptosyltransferase)
MGDPPGMTSLHDMLAGAAALPADQKPAAAVAALMRQVPPSAYDGFTFYALGNALFREGRLEEADAALRRSVHLDPNRAEAFNDLAATLFAMGRETEAVVFIRRALDLAPDLAEAEETDAIWLLRYGRFREGWRKYEARMRTHNNKHLWRDFAQPRWRGEPLDGRTILLHSEQGLGDTIQFVRYAPLVAQRGGRVVLEVYPHVRPLLDGLPGIDRIIVRGEAVPPFDTYCSLLSLPLAFRTDLDSIPANVPYLRAREDKVLAWRRRLGPRRGLRVGIAWSGNPAHRDDTRRSIPFPLFRTLLRDDPRVSFYVVQADVRADDTEALTACPHVHNHARHLTDFGETAALLSLLDIVIGVDTSVMHLAGALGVPGWILLMNVADWRWLLTRDDSPWYPSLELFRQPRRGDWEAVLAAVSGRLEEMLV